MNIAGKVIWQQAAGDGDRNYADLCLKWDVILNGPGYAGSWPECKDRLRSEGVSARKVTDLRRFAEEMKDSDLVVLRMGTSKVLGVGQLVGSYEWRDEFGDVDGWELQHVRRVRWLWKNQDKPKTFNTYDLNQGDTTQKLQPGPVTAWLASLSVSAAKLAEIPIDLPTQSSPEDVNVDEISEFLFDHGVASASISALLNEIGELTRIARWYQRASKRARQETVSIKATAASKARNQRASKPSEHETVAYLVAPLLRALGWTPQRMAVEWNHVDVALFERLPRSDETLRVVVEAKKMDNSCLSAVSQAMSYSNGKPACHRLIVTDGLRYGVHTRSGIEPFRLRAYLNLTRLRRAYPIYGCGGAKEALLAMAPEWKSAEG